MHQSYLQEGCTDIAFELQSSVMAASTVVVETEQMTWKWVTVEPLKHSNITVHACIQQQCGMYTGIWNIQVFIYFENVWFDRCLLASCSALCRVVSSA